MPYFYATFYSQKGVLHMNITDFLEATLFTLGDNAITAGALAKFVLILVVMLLFHRLIAGQLLPTFFEKNKFGKKWKRKVRRNVNLIFFLILVLGFLWALGLDAELWSGKNLSIRISTLVYILLVIQLARILDWVISRYLLDSYIAKHASTNNAVALGLSCIVRKFGDMRWVVKDG